MFLYQKGWFNAESPEIKYNDSRHLQVAHEIVHLLDYDNKPCINEENYRNDICKHEFIHKVTNVLSICQGDVSQESAHEVGAF